MDGKEKMAVFSTFLALSSLCLVAGFPDKNKAVDEGFGRGNRDHSKADRIRVLEETLTTVSRQLMMQQFYVEEQTRANGNSGLKRVRNSKVGTRPYYSASHVNSNIASIHNHANTDRVIGMGEFVGVLNGVEFRTRHNDYHMAMKSTTTTEYGAVEDIPYPPVPPQVSQQVTVPDQIAEMKKWFKAWAEQDYTVRDYRPYFKPVLCYLEGRWTNSDQETIEESFDSDRHHLDAKSWLDLQEKVRFTSYSGTKDGLENFAYLPTTVFSLLNDTYPVLAQWNFQILCHPLKDDVPLNRFRQVDDLKARMSLGLNDEDYASSRAARFQLSPEDIDQWEDRATYYTYLDDLMSQVPGADNYPGRIEDNLFGDQIYPFDPKAKDPLNVGYYHRAYRVKSPGAMGLKTRRRGFGDENLFLAQTTHKKVAGLPVEHCNKRGLDCQTWFQRWTYAIPLEIIYMTPLTKWNPYGIVHKGDVKSRHGKTIFDGPNGARRNGNENRNEAYNGTNSRVFYLTPEEFFQGEGYLDPADTTKESTCVLDAGGNMRRVRASGYRIHIPEIPGVGSLRQRYPIMPIHGEGSSVWKELEALKDLILHPSKYRYLFGDEMPLTSPPQENCVSPRHMCGTTENEQANELQTPVLHFMLDESSSEYGSHTHHFELSPLETARYLAGDKIDVITEEEYGHQHALQISQTTRNGKMIDIAKKCDGEMRCWDGHDRKLVRVSD